MKKGQVLEGIVERVVFPNKGIVSVEGEEQKVIVKNAIEGQKIRFSINKKRKGKAEGRLLEVIGWFPWGSLRGKQRSWCLLWHREDVSVGKIKPVIRWLYFGCRI